MTQTPDTEQRLSRAEFTKIVASFKDEWQAADEAGQVGRRSERALEAALSGLGILVQTELPSEPGLYKELKSRNAGSVDLWTRTADGRWLSHAGARYDNRAAEFGPFARLVTLEEARPIIAAEIADWLEQIVDDQSALNVRDHFGVSE